MKRQIFIGIAATALILAACSTQEEASKTPVEGQEVLRSSFDTADGWEEGSYPAQAADPDSTLTVTSGRYQIDHRAGRSASFIWGTGEETYEDIIIEVKTEQLSGYKNNLFGVVCHLTTNDRGDPTGHALLISGDGHYGIAALENRSLTFLREWHQSDAVNEGQAANTLRVICVDDYLGLYVNGEFAGEVTNVRNTQPGQVALIAGVNANQGVSVAFDDLVIFEGTLGDE